MSASESRLGSSACVAASLPDSAGRFSQAVFADPTASMDLTPTADTLMALATSAAAVAIAANTNSTAGSPSSSCPPMQSSLVAVACSQLHRVRFSADSHRRGAQQLPIHRCGVDSTVPHGLGRRTALPAQTTPMTVLSDACLTAALVDLSVSSTSPASQTSRVYLGSTTGPDVVSDFPARSTGRCSPITKPILPRSVLEAGFKSITPVRTISLAVNATGDCDEGNQKRSADVTGPATKDYAGGPWGTAKDDTSSSKTIHVIGFDPAMSLRSPSRSSGKSQNEVQSSAPAHFPVTFVDGLKVSFPAESLLSNSLHALPGTTVDSVGQQSNVVDRKELSDAIRSVSHTQERCRVSFTLSDRRASSVLPVASSPLVALRRHASLGSGKAMERQDSFQSAASAPSGCISASSFSSLPPSPAVSFLSSIAEITSSIPSPDMRGWDGERIGEYLIGKKIGTGNFSDVHEAFITNDMTTDTHLVAVKVISRSRNPCTPYFSQLNEEKCMETFKKNQQARLNREINIWRQAKHDNIVQLFEIVETSDHCFLFSEYCKNSHLLDYVNQAAPGGLTEDISRYLFTQAVDSVLYLHEELHVVHRDIKLENLLLTTDCDGRLKVKLCDFGLSEYFFPVPSSATCSSVSSASLDSGRPVSPDQMQCAGSLAYCAPEELDRTLLTASSRLLANIPSSSPYPARDSEMVSRPQLFHPPPSADVWSLGVVLYVLLTGSLPFADEFMPRLQMQILNGRYLPLATPSRPDPHPMVAWGTMCPRVNYAAMPKSGSPRRLFSEEAGDLVSGILNIHVAERLSIRQVRDHSWMR